MGDEYGGTPYDMSSAALTGAGNAYTELGDTSVVDNLDQYMNPYTENVIDRTTDNMMQANEGLLSANADAADAANAFGGGRHGVVDAITNYETAQGIGDMSANLYNTAYNNATDLAQTDFTNKQSVAGDALDFSSQAFDTGTALLDMQQSQGDAAQSTSQEFMDQAAAIFDGNDPYEIVSQIQALLSGSELTDNSTATGSTTASGAEQFAAVTGAVGDLMGIAK